MSPRRLGANVLSGIIHNHPKVKPTQTSTYLHQKKNCGTATDIMRMELGRSMLSQRPVTKDYIRYDFISHGLSRKANMQTEG